MHATMVAVLGSVLFGCERPRETESVSRPAELGESGALVSADGWRDCLVRSSKSFLDEAIRSTLTHFGQRPLGTAHIEAGLRRLSPSMYREDRTPLSLFGTYGHVGNGTPYVNVVVLNEHRETAALWLLFSRDDGGDEATIRISLPLHEKEVEIALQHFFRIQHVSWQELRGDSPQDQDRTIIQVSATADRTVRLPRFDGWVVVAGAEDRLNGLGNFVPLTEADWLH